MASPRYHILIPGNEHFVLTVKIYFYLHVYGWPKTITPIWNIVFLVTNPNKNDLRNTMTKNIYYSNYYIIDVTQNCFFSFVFANTLAVHRPATLRRFDQVHVVASSSSNDKTWSAAQVQLQTHQILWWTRGWRKWKCCPVVANQSH